MDDRASDSTEGNEREPLTVNLNEAASNFQVLKRKRAINEPDDRAISPPPLKRQAVATGSVRSTVTGSPFRLMTIRDLPASANVDTLSLHQILGDPLIKQCWFFDFLHDVDFIMKHFDEDVRATVLVKIVHGSWKTEDPNRNGIEDAIKRWSNVQAITAYMPEIYGTHHTKMMIIFRHDELAQVIIHTANMIAQDWTNMTQAIWRSPLLPLLQPNPTKAGTAQHTSSSDPEASPNHSMGSGPRFKHDLLRYTGHYGKRLSQLTQELIKYDFRAVRAALVASVPTTVLEQSVHPTKQTSFGWPGLREVFSQIPVRRPASEKALIVAQVSSIATLTNEWIDHFLAVLSTNQPEDPAATSPPDCRVMFPTVDEVRRSLDGYQSGSSIHLRVQSARQQKMLTHLRPLLVHWAGDQTGEGYPPHAPVGEAGRRRAAPHVKSYIRFNSQAMERIDWAMVSSANLSTQAWGGMPKDGKIKICSYELGVVVWPGLFDEDAVMVPTFGKDMPTPVGSERRPAGRAGDTVAPAALHGETQQLASPLFSSNTDTVETQSAIDAEDSPARPLASKEQQQQQSTTPSQSRPDQTGSTPGQPIVGLRMPYDVPLVSYRADEQPWIATAAYDEPDWKGKQWTGWG